MIFIVLPRYLVPVRPRSTVFEGYGLAVVDGRIDMVAPAKEVISKFPDCPRYELDQHVLLPGLVNMHTHAPMTLLRGFADDLRLDIWLNEHIWPAENRWVDGDFVQQGTELAMAEMIRGGTTCFNDMYFFPDRAAQAVEQAGMRACIGIAVIDFKTAWADSFDEYLEKGLAVREHYKANERVHFSISPHSMYSVTSEMLTNIARLSESNDLPVHLHLLEIEWEIQDSVMNHGMRPLQRVEQLGLLNERLIAVHMAHLRDEDLDLLAGRRVNVVHCPQSNLKLASGMCRSADLIAAGVNLSIGTDGAASNNDQDLLEELRTASLLAKGIAHDPRVFDAQSALDTVTINGAKALGLEAEIGSIEPGKAADLCAIDLGYARTQPVHHVISQVVYAASSSQVSDVWVAGQQLLKQGRLTTLDEKQILDNAAQWSTRMRPEMMNEEKRVS